MSVEQASQLFVDISNKFPKITYALLDGHLKKEAKNRCINIFKEDFNADTSFVTRGFKIKSE